jgi:hypothetical protein
LRSRRRSFSVVSQYNIVTSTATTGNASKPACFVRMHAAADILVRLHVEM